MLPLFFPLQFNSYIGFIMVNFWDTIIHFKYTEFDSPDDVLSGLNMNHYLIRILDCMRDIMQLPFIINSGFRTASHNQKINGRNNSAHLKGLAVDIKSLSNRFNFTLIELCISLKISRIGIYESHIHIDCDYSLPHPLIWWGKPYQPPH